MNNFPQPPQMYYPQSYTSNGMDFQQMPQQPQMMQPMQQPVIQPSGLGAANFSGLIGTHVIAPTSATQQLGINTETTKKKRKKKEEPTSSTELEVVEDKPEVVNSREIVENTIYADTYNNTNMLTYGIINQTEELLRECKQDLDFIRGQRNMKGKFHYMNATLASMSSLLSTKLAAIKEINTTIKTVNENEYRRFKDMRAMDNTDDNKAIMDAYSAFISAPVGAPEYHLPGTASLTGGLNGVVMADYPPEVQRTLDRGMANYLANSTPEEKLMLLDNDKDLEEVIVYDQATGVKKFQWMNTRTGEMHPELPASSSLTLEDYVIDPRTARAKNTNLNSIKKVVTLNQGAFDKF